MTDLHGDSAQDPTGTIRVHPDDDPAARDARRIIRTDLGHGMWRQITGPRTRGIVRPAAWPVQPLPEVARVLGHQPGGVA